MGKALVFKDVDFSDVALDTVTLVIERIPCTGITLDQSAVSITSLDAVTLTATVTPADTTDSITWSSSDTSVCTVSNDVITPLKSGTATITATCGEYSATCEITADITVTLNAHMTFGYVAFYTSPNFVTINTNEVCGMSLITDGTGRYAYDANSVLPEGTKAYPLILPDNCAQVSVTVPLTGIKVTAQWVDTTQWATGAPANKLALRVGGDASAWSSSVANGSRTMDVPSGANAVYITCYKSGITQENLDNVVVTAIL